MITWAIIPVKPLRDSKSRLAGILPARKRAQLTVDILRRTLEILDNSPAIDRTLVVSRDPAVLKEARLGGASTYVETDRQDLNLALTRAAHVATAQHADCLLILPADLPLIEPADVEMILSALKPSSDSKNGINLGHLQRTMAICTDHMQDGTNALAICPPVGFKFQYGPGSFQLHLDEAERLGMARRIVHAPSIKFDLDTEEDWRTYQVIRAEVEPV
jgi:2-phospho-L-lactate guanylyltransferase